MQIFRNILVPIDFSAYSDNAVRVASELSAAFSAPILLVHVYDPVAYPLPDGYVMYTPGQLSKMWTEFDRRLEQAQRDAMSIGAVAADTRLLQGLTAEEITRVARDGGFDLIVMGSHGRRGLQRFLLGSVTARVLQTAPCAVLTVKLTSSEQLRRSGPRGPGAAALSA
jgi:nucleotide-binding universal stress UspA family protein